MALSTMNSSAKRMWQKFFLLFRIAVISPHCSKTSWIISSVAFSGNPPTNTVLHPGGLSLVEGGGRSKSKQKSHWNTKFVFWSIGSTHPFNQFWAARVTWHSIEAEERDKQNNWILQRLSKIDYLNLNLFKLQVVLQTFIPATVGCSSGQSVA